MVEPETGLGDPPIGDRYRTATSAEGQEDELVKQYAAQAKEQQASTVNLLSHALDLVARDLGIDSQPALIDVAWIPSTHLDEVDPPWGGLNRLRKEGNWVGIVYVKGRRQLVVDVDVSYVEQLPFQLAQSIQDAVIEEVREARPACPVHGHPLTPVATPSGSIWECPDGAKIWSCPIGSYHQASGSTSIN
jgi:hypothetical protein